MHFLAVSLILFVYPSTLAAPTSATASIVESTSSGVTASTVSSASTSATASTAGPASLSSTTSTAGPVTTSASTNGTTSKPFSAGWYPDWAVLPLSNISWHKYDMMTYAFGLTTNNVSKIELSNPSNLTTFVTAAHANNGTAALLSIGGWEGSQYFSTAVASAKNRTAFVKTIVDLVNEYELEGVELDWEYPNSPGIGCNTFSVNDTTNYLSFLQELRKEPTKGKDIYISAAVGNTPFLGADGTPGSDVSDFPVLLDHITIMNYDISGNWSDTVGPNAPLTETCASGPSKGSAVSALKAWTDAGMPVEKIVLGVAAYGHSFKVSESESLPPGHNYITMFPEFDKQNVPVDYGADVGSTELDACGNITSPSDVFTFQELISNGFLTENGTAANGIVYSYDECSRTPFVYNSTTQVMVSYDDTTSFEAKGQFIANQHMKGFEIWNVAGDSGDRLLNAIQDGMLST